MERDRTRVRRRLGFVAIVAMMAGLGTIPVPPALGFGSSTRPPLPSVSAGGFVTCGVTPFVNVTTGEDVMCWGDNAQGAAQPPAGLKFIEVNVGYDTTCGVTKQFDPVCWGNPASGGTAPPEAQVNHIVAGFNFGCAIRTLSAEIVCWGADDAGQVSNAPAAGAYKALSVGIRFGCALDFDNAMVCWGDNSYGQLNIPAPNNFTAMTTGNFDTCGIRPDGTAVCWGRNAGGQADVPTGTFTQISAGFQHVCGLRPDGTISCWGNDNFGQASPPPGTYTQVSAGTFHSCAMPTSGAPAVCWGQNAAGRVMPELTSGDPPDGTVGTPYTHQFETTFLSPEGTYTLTEGGMPPGLSLSPTGTISGTPTSAGTYTGTVSMTNGLSPTVTNPFSITVAEGGGGTTTSTSTTVPAQNTVTAVSGSAYGASVVALQGGHVNPPVPSVILPATGGGPITDTSQGVSVGALTTGAMSVSTQGTVGAAGQAESTAVVNNATVPTNPPSEPPLFTAMRVDSQCQSTAEGSTGSVSIVGGFVRDTPIDFLPEVNTTINDPLYGNVTLNEQIANETATSSEITVTAVRIHRFPNDDIILGRVHCDVTFAGGTTPTTSTTSTTSTTRPTTTTSTTRPTSTTSTTVVSPPPSLNCQRDDVGGTPVIECRIVDRDGIRRINVTDLTTREREQSIPFPGGRHIIPAAHFNIAADGNSHRVHLNDAAGNVHVWFVGPDGTVTPKT